ncbi:hypothetical protein CY34DRAFT_12187 [Suillus luteus UH-Slu-Lm8-n1]|uniref:Uncharacterized protein n=1 Tax=Suillus luteus UH-Slu-Lm8-n1 TaxID=930992 RepID=A0A0D0ALK2_9AGAM|nr:hypothetical protein CY34DRAFT_12187 [Suillus luteus UH-Slu-Lm8-n1]
MVVSNNVWAEDAALILRLNQRIDSSPLASSPSFPELSPFPISNPFVHKMPPMAAPSTATEERLHLSSLFAYDALPNHQDLDSMTYNAKFTAGTGTDFYDCSLTSRRYALVGVACSSIFGYACFATGIVTLANHGVMGVTHMHLQPMYSIDSQLVEILALAFNLIVTLCTESIGFVHDISLRSALASESRLRFNTNLRLLTAARGWRNPNGALLNSISAILLIISYSSASLVFCLDFQWVFTEDESVALAGLPLLILGVALLLQVMIALSGMRAVKILTWSSSPFDLTAALVHHTQLTPATSRCMRCVSALEVFGDPARPSEIQPSAWHAHPSIRKVVISLWGIVAACAGWAVLIMYLWGKYADSNTGVTPVPLTTQTWSFIPNLQNGLVNRIEYVVPKIGIQWWILVFVNVAIVQGPLTPGLHCSELIANVIRDERQWRCATRRKGLKTATNPVKPIFTHPICLVLFVAKPFLHWMFGLSFYVSNTAEEEQEMQLAVGMLTAQIWNLCIALLIFACFFTFVALRRPRGPQPAAYGHVQTLANLVDEWSPVMWWGHKEDGIPYCHAGTSDHPLPDVKMDCVYAGSDAGALASEFRKRGAISTSG